MISEELAQKKKKLLQELAQATENGDEEREKQLLKQVPIDHALAYAIREVGGMNVLKKYNLEEARAVYGEHSFD